MNAFDVVETTNVAVGDDGHSDAFLDEFDGVQIDRFRLLVLGAAMHLQHRCGPMETGRTH